MQGTRSEWRPVYCSLPFGVVETQTPRTNETSLIRAIAWEIHSVAREILHSPPHLQAEEQTTSTRRKTTPRRGSGTVGTNLAGWGSRTEELEVAIGETAMGREDSEPTSPSEPVGDGMPAEERTDERLNSTDNCEGEASEEGIDTDGDEEDTNLDLRGSLLESRVLPDPEETAAVRSTTALKWSNTWRGYNGR